MRIFIRSLICIFIGIAVLCSCTHNSHDYNEILYEKISPSQKYKIVVFNRNVNMTTNKNYQASIIKANQSLNNDAGNILITDSEIVCEWISDIQISITLDKNSRIYKRQDKFNNISILYNETSG